MTAATKTRPRKKTKKTTKGGKTTKQPTWSVITFKKIEEWREKLGLSKSAMAEALSVTNSTYHNWRKGRTVPHANQQEEILTRIKALENNSAAGGGGSKGNSKGKGGSSSGDASTGNRGRTGRGSTSDGGGGNGDGDNTGRPRRTTGHPTRTPDVYTPPSGTLPGPGIVPRDDVATIAAAWIQSQKKPVSAGSVVSFVQELRSAL